MKHSKYKKQADYGHVYGDSLPTPEGRICWPFITKPKPAPEPKEGQKQGDPRFEATLILPKNSKEVKEFIAEIKSMTDEMLVAFNQGRSASLGDCALLGKYGDGDEADHEKYPFYKGCWVLIARNAKPVKTVDKNRKIIETSTVVGGLKGKFVITPMITAHGISYKLLVVQVREDDGTRFAGAARDAVELLEACEDEETEIGVGEALDEAIKLPAKRGRPAKQGKEAALDLL